MTGPGRGVASDVEHTQVLVIGAGQAGLSAAHHLARLGLDHIVLDAEAGPGGAWRHRWPTLRMATVHGIFALPGTAFAPPDPAARAADAVPAYFAAYERDQRIVVRRPVTVTAVHSAPDPDGGDTDGSDTDGGDTDGGLRADTDHGPVHARALINATGTWTRPFVPTVAGAADFRGRMLHARDYRGPDELAGRRVLVVGGGTTALGLLTEIAEVAETIWVTRRAPVFRDGPFTVDDGRRVVGEVDARVRAGLAPESVVGRTELFWTPELRAAAARGVLTRHPMPTRILADAVRWADGVTRPVDVIVWATGWRAALDHLAPLRLREPGGGIRMDGTRVVADPPVHLVGYGPSASTVGANRAGREAAVAVRDRLAVPAAA